jgi:Mg2+-importing ATPase
VWVVSFLVAERTDAVVIAVIVVMSVGLGFVYEYRAEPAVNALHDRLRHRALVLRDGYLVSRDVADLVPGDVVELWIGAVVLADARLTAVRALQRDESVLSGEALPRGEDGRRHGPDGDRGRGRCGCGRGHRDRGAYGVRSDRRRLGECQAPTAFQVGLGRFSVLLVWSRPSSLRASSR